VAPNNRNRGGAGTGNLSLVRGEAPTFSRIEDPLPDTLPETFIDRYRNWGSSVTDAPSQYHTLNAVVILSTIMCPYTSLKTSYGEIRPNIWTMILAGTTVTRKSTTMDMAKAVLNDIGIDYLMGTDGSPEGILGEMQDRDGTVSMFHRDEITGWIEQASKKDYMSGLLESFTRMYDGQEESRVLRSGKMTVKKPRLVILSGGIKTRMTELITMDHIRSGFIPRFIMVSGTTSPDQIRPIGPPPASLTTEDPRDAILSELQNLCAFWIQEAKATTVTVAGMQKQIVSKPEPREMTATPDAWTRIRQLKDDAILMGEATTSQELYTPILDRLSNSIIKVAMLLAGARESCIVDYTDVVQAVRYSQEWLASAMDFAQRVEEAPDMNPWEKKADKIVKYIQKAHPEPVTRSQIMRQFHVRTKDIQDVEHTLIARGHVKVTNVPSVGKTSRSRVEYTVGDTASNAESETTYKKRVIGLNTGD
jgi:hypothetical protein